MIYIRYIFRDRLRDLMSELILVLCGVRYEQEKDFAAICIIIRIIRDIKKQSIRMTF